MDVYFGVFNFLGVEQLAHMQRVVQICHFAQCVFGPCDLNQVFDPLNAAVNVDNLVELFLSHGYGQMSNNERNPVFLFSVFFSVILDDPKNFRNLTKLVPV